MKIAILTSNSLRHKFFANKLSNHADSCIVISECQINDSEYKSNEMSVEIKNHFKLRFEAEKEYFKGNDCFLCNTLPLLYKETNLKYVYDLLKCYNPDVMFVFGSSLIKEPLVSLMPKGRFINLHLGLSPYYRGSGTNFFPFVNNELDYVGSTIHCLSSGIDDGDIISHVRPEFEHNDTVHTVGCKVIRDSTYECINILEKIKKGDVIKPTKQWDTELKRYYRSSDFNDEVLQKYYTNLKSGMISRYVNSKKKPIRLISLR